MNRSYHLYLILALFFFSCNNQNNVGTNANEIDYILNVHNNANTDISYLVYNDLKDTEKLLNQHAYLPDSMRAENDYFIGKYFNAQGELDSTLKYAQRATTYVSKNITKRQKKYFQMSWNASISLEQFGNCFALSKQLKSVLNEQDYLSMALVYFFDKEVCMRIPDYERALENNEMYIKMLRLSADTVNITAALISQAKIKYSLHDKQSTFKILNNLVDQQQNLTDNYKRLLYGEYGIYLFYESRFEEALTYYQKGLNFTKKLDKTPQKRNYLATGYCNITEVSMKLGQYENAQLYLDSVRALGLYNIRSNLRRSVLRYQTRLHSILERDVTSYLDTIFQNQDRQSEIHFKDQLSVVRKASENENRLLLEKQKAELDAVKLRSRLILILVFSLVLALSGGVLYWYRKGKFEKESLQVQQRLFRAQMNPHFTFNALYAIKNQIRKNPESAENYLQRFSRMLRLILENSLHNYVLLEKEIESLREYLSLQLLRYPLKFTYEFTMENIEEDDPIFIPPMIFQPIIENSIEHGFKNIGFQGKISISLVKNRDFIVCAVEDNGSGLNNSDTEGKTSASMFLVSNFLKKTTGKELEIINKGKDQTGVIVRFTIPFKNSRV